MITMDSALKNLMNKGTITGKAAYHAAIEKRGFEDVKELNA
jgi:Tfp pilus assembly pilus retraction ATPase PilT